MGSLVSQPKTPAVQYVPRNPTVVGTPTPAETPSTPITPDSLSEPVQDDDEISAAVRTSSLLNRTRGRLGTVLTGFRGFLSSADTGADTQHKSLLGE